MLSPPDVLKARILIVDDEPANILLLERMLAETGYTSIASTMVPTSVHALHKDSDFDLILLDLQMPVMDGFEVMDRLTQKALTGYLPVIVLTAQPAHKLRALQAGARDFISKPFDLLEVKTRIRNMLEVRLLYRELARYNDLLEQTVRERTAELRESEERYRRLTQLASDWHWEQDEEGHLRNMSGPAMEMLGIAADPLIGGAAMMDASGWDETQRAALRSIIAARQPFLDFILIRARDNGAHQNFRISGEPIFNEQCRFVGYRGVGVEFTETSRSPFAGG